MSCPDALARENAVAESTLASGSAGSPPELVVVQIYRTEVPLGQLKERAVRLGIVVNRELRTVKGFR
jgi:hypothetical protein